MQRSCWVNIILHSKLNLKKVRNISFTCKGFYDILFDENIWKHLCEMDFDYLPVNYLGNWKELYRIQLETTKDLNKRSNIYFVSIPTSPLVPGNSFETVILPLDKEYKTTKEGFVEGIPFKIPPKKGDVVILDSSICNRLSGSYYIFNGKKYLLIGRTKNKEKRGGIFFNICRIVKTLGKGNSGRKEFKLVHSKKYKPSELEAILYFPINYWGNVAYKCFIYFEPERFISQILENRVTFVERMNVSVKNEGSLSIGYDTMLEVYNQEKHKEIKWRDVIVESRFFHNNYAYLINVSFIDNCDISLIEDCNVSDSLDKLDYKKLFLNGIYYSKNSEGKDSNRTIYLVEEIREGVKYSNLF